MDLLLNIEYGEGNHSNVSDLMNMPWHWILTRMKFLEKRAKRMEQAMPKSTRIGDKVVSFG